MNNIIIHYNIMNPNFGYTNPNSNYYYYDQHTTYPPNDYYNSSNQCNCDYNGNYNQSKYIKNKKKKKKNKKKKIGRFVLGLASRIADVVPHLR